jgi:hypothetical protein
MAIGVYGPETFDYASGAPARGIPVYVYDSGTLNKAQLFFDANGLSSAPNPLITDQYGQIFFFVELGDYDLVASSVTTPITVDQPVIPTPSDASFTWHQANAGTTWTIPHLLGFNPAGIELIDSQNEHIGYDTLTYIDDNNLALTFSAAVSGTAYLS